MLFVSCRRVTFCRVYWLVARWVLFLPSFFFFSSDKFHYQHTFFFFKSIYLWSSSRRRHDVPIGCLTVTCALFCLAFPVLFLTPMSGRTPLAATPMLFRENWVTFSRKLGKRIWRRCRCVGALHHPWACSFQFFVGLLARCKREGCMVPVFFFLRLLSLGLSECATLLCHCNACLLFYFIMIVNSFFCSVFVASVYVDSGLAEEKRKSVFL